MAAAMQLAMDLVSREILSGRYCPMTSAEIARDRLLWCQNHDPVTRPSQKRMMAQFKRLGYRPAFVYEPYPLRGQSLIRGLTRRGKPVLTPGDPFRLSGYGS